MLDEVLEPVLGDVLGELLLGGLSLAELPRVPFLAQAVRPSVAMMMAAAVMSLGFFFIISSTGLFVAQSPARTGFAVTSALRYYDELLSPHCNAPAEIVYPAIDGIEHGKLSGRHWEILPGSSVDHMRTVVAKYGTQRCARCRADEVS